jgi:hypothetical protein
MIVPENIFFGEKTITKNKNMIFFPFQEFFNVFSLRRDFLEIPLPGFDTNSFSKKPEKNLREKTL